mmetsp:Transcript_22603/g.66899  ORF Transcript_22603/g.66899 Transcript_22603/m.66899 type:complete len:358 (+) Transcript_22603:2290-3363(+)
MELMAFAAGWRGRRILVQLERLPFLLLLDLAVQASLRALLLSYSSRCPRGDTERIGGRQPVGRRLGEIGNSALGDTGGGGTSVCRPLLPLDVFPHLLLGPRPLFQRLLRFLQFLFHPSLLLLDLPQLLVGPMIRVGQTLDHIGLLLDEADQYRARFRVSRDGGDAAVGVRGKRQVRGEGGSNRGAGRLRGGGHRRGRGCGLGAGRRCRVRKGDRDGRGGDRGRGRTDGGGRRWRGGRSADSVSASFDTDGEGRDEIALVPKIFAAQVAHARAVPAVSSAAAGATARGRGRHRVRPAGARGARRTAAVICVIASASAARPRRGREIHVVLSGSQSTRAVRRRRGRVLLMLLMLLLVCH